jgi:hypothetical protein
MLRLPHPARTAAGDVRDVPVCRWEDDNIQFEDPTYEGGANRVSLRQARKNFRRHGVSDKRRRHSARLPNPDEQPRLRSYYD